MNFFYLLLVLACLIGNSFSLDKGITISDPICVFFAVIAFYKVFTKSWHMDSFFKLTVGYVPFMLFSALANGTILNTVFLNFFRNYIFIPVIYLIVINSINSSKDLKLFCFLIFIYVVFFLSNFSTAMQDTYYQDLNQIDFEFGRNNVAFVSLLLSIFCAFLYYSKLFGKYVLLLIPFLVLVMVSCASRFAIIMLVLGYLIFRLFSKTKISVSEVCILFFLVLLTPYFMRVMNSFVDETFFAMSQEYLEEKLNNATDDLYQTRILSINYKPIILFMSLVDVSQILCGDGVSIQHSFVSHTIITTGVFGFLYYIFSFFYLSKKAFCHKQAGMFLFVLFITMNINDFVTNARFIVGVNSLLFAAIAATIYKYILLNEDSYISDRVC